ncbi:MAG: hypothetical protein LUF28_09395 [Clostridiales bacterium]|nr:hypothetical protein [Clostridiales bacterium]
MTAEAAKQWAEEMERRSSAFEKCLETHWTDDSCGWGALLKNLWWTEEATTRPSGLLLTGPEGCGRHTAAAHMVRFLQEQNFGSIWLSGDDLLEEGNVSEAREKLNALLDDFNEHEKCLCLVIEQLEGRSGRKELLSYLGKLLWDYWLVRKEGADSRLFLILIDSGRGIPSLLREQLQRCRMTLPDLEHRNCFLESREGLAGFVSLDDCAAYTEGFTYAQLMDLARDLQMLITSKNDALVSREQLEQLVEDQREETPAAQSVRRRAALEERLIHLADELPALLKNASFSGGTPVEVHQEQGEKLSPQTGALSPDYSTMKEDDQRASVEAQPVKELVADLFGNAEEANLLVAEVQQAQQASMNATQNAAETESAPIPETEEELSAVPETGNR